MGVEEHGDRDNIKKKKPICDICRVGGYFVCYKGIIFS
jgi:hypothetical protein